MACLPAELDLDAAIVLLKRKRPRLFVLVREIELVTRRYGEETKGWTSALWAFHLGSSSVRQLERDQVFLRERGVLHPTEMRVIYRCEGENSTARRHFPSDERRRSAAAGAAASSAEGTDSAGAPPTLREGSAGGSVFAPPSPPVSGYRLPEPEAGSGTVMIQLPETGTGPAGDAGDGSVAAAPVTPMAAAGLHVAPPRSARERLIDLGMDAAKAAARVREFGEARATELLDWLPYGNFADPCGWIVSYLLHPERTIPKRMQQARAADQTRLPPVNTVVVGTATAQSASAIEEALSGRKAGRRIRFQEARAPVVTELPDPDAEGIAAWRACIEALIDGIPERKQA